MQEENNRKGSFGVTIFLMLLSGALLFFTVKQKMDLDKNKEELARQISKEVSENIKKELSSSDIVEEKSKFPDYDAIKGNNPDPKIKNINISSDYVNNNPATLDFDGVKKIISQTVNFLGHIYIWMPL